jgi:hypothetical protein
MWAGMSRNDAADVAQLAQEAGRPYFKVLGELLNFHRQDFDNPLAWIKMRHTIIHGHNSPAGRFFANIDEMANHKDPAVEQALAAGTAAKPSPVIVLHTSSPVDWSRFDWPPQPQPAAGFLYATEQAAQMQEPAKWPKENPHRCDAMDALAYNMQIIPRADHDTLHGCACGVDLAAGPDFTEYKPVVRLDSFIITPAPVLPDMTRKTATELAGEIMEKIQRQGGGWHD